MLSEALNAYFSKLVDLDNAERQLIAETDRYSRFIDERVLWIGSTTPLTATDFRGAGDALWWLAGPPSLLEIAETWAADAMRAPAIWVLSAALVTALVFCRRRLRRKIGQIGERAARKDCSQFRPTLEAAAWTAAVAAAWPGLAWYLGWRLIAAADASDLCKACGAGLTAAAGLYAMLELFRQVCAAGGLGETHFGWPAGALKLLRQNLPVEPVGPAAAGRGDGRPHARGGSHGTARWAGSASSRCC